MTLNNSGILIDIIANLMDSLIVIAKDEGIKNTETKDTLKSAVFKLKGLYSALKWIHCFDNGNPYVEDPYSVKPQKNGLTGVPCSSTDATKAFPYGANPFMGSPFYAQNGANPHPASFDPAEWDKKMREKMDEVSARMQEASVRYQKEMDEISKGFQQSK